MEQLDSGRIHLWLAWLGEITDSRMLAEYRSLLSEEELDKQARFHFERDRHRYLVTRAMVRTVLSKYADVEPRGWLFSSNPYGRPTIHPQLSSAGKIEFNVSHTDGLVVMGVTHQRAIGVDVENVRTRHIDIEIADRYFAPTEVAALRALHREQQRQRFFEYWTLKESYVKARGMGLSIPLNRFAIDVDDRARIRLMIDSVLGDSSERWSLWQMRFAQTHVIAVCAEQVGTRGRLELSAPRSWK